MFLKELVPIPKDEKGISKKTIDGITYVYYTYESKRQTMRHPLNQRRFFSGVFCGTSLVSLVTMEANHL